MSKLIMDLFVSFLVGAASSAAVAIIFYRLSSRDTEMLHRQGQLDAVSMRLRELDPRAWSNNYRGHYGVDNMVHWLTCMAEVMAETGFSDGANTLKRISDEMLQVCPGPNTPSPLSTEEAEQRKTTWKRAVTELRAAQPRSLLNRRCRTLISPA
jgi:hypothetical protein